MTVTRSVIGVGLIAILVAAGSVLAESAVRRSGTNTSPNLAFVESLAPGAQLCQDQELLPADTAALQLTIGTYGSPGGRLGVRFTGANGRTLASGALAPGWKQGLVRIPVSRVAKTSQARFCLRNDGPPQIALAGVSGEPGYSLRVAGRVVADQRLRIEYLRPGRESWLTLAPTIVHRLSLGRSSSMRGWAWLATLLLLLAAIALAVRALASEDAS